MLIRFIIVTLLSLAALTVTGCRPRQTAVEAARADQTLLLGNGAEPGDLDPHLATAFTEYNVIIALGEGLTAIDEATGKPVPAAAASWEVSPDRLRYTFHLRPEARWSNGEPVTAADFVFSFERILRPALASEYAYMLFPVLGAEAFNAGKTSDFTSVGVSAPDTRTLVVELARPTPYFLGLVAHQAWFPVHPPTILKFGRLDQRGTAWTRPENYVGNGPYRLAAWVPNDRIEVVRHPYHYADANAGPRRVVFFPTDNIPADEAAYRAGQRHATYDLLPDRIATYRAQMPSPIRVDPLLETLYLRFNTTRAPLDDIRVRRALALAIDRQAIATSVLQGSRLPASHYTPPGTGGYQAEARQTYDPAAARALLAAAGFPDGNGFRRLEVLMNTDAINTRILEAIQAMWKRELGIDVALVSQDYRVYLDAMKGLRYDVARARWIGDYNDPNTYLDMFVSGGGNNQTGWSSPAYDRLIAEAANAATPTERQARFQAAEALLLEEAPIAPVVFGARVHLLHPEVQNWRPSLLGVRRYQNLRFASAASTP
ncbi:MAG: peptide ABC transporter substrate-binding protein [Verrucomicrobia bacterium]|nr:peptide ABC transporter substrate-binding protein [Verrucomicrobiota bacterium]